MGERSALGIGRIHGEFYHFLAMGGMMQVMMPKSLIDCIKSFEAVKWKLSDQREIIRLARCVLEGYRQIERAGLASSEDVNKLTILDEALSNSAESFELSVLHNFKPSMISLFFGGGERSQKSIMSLPIIDINACISPTGLDEIMRKYTEILVGDVVMLGSMMGYSIGNNSEESIVVMNNLLYAGFGYVTTPDGRMLPTISQNRAAFFIGYTKDELCHKFGLTPTRRMRKRYKSVRRVWRKNRAEDGVFSLRVNTNFSTALCGLREHHKDVWVGAQLEEI